MPSAATPPPDPGALSGLLAALSFIGGIGGANALADGPYPRPGSSPSQVRQYFTQNAGPARLGAPTAPCPGRGDGGDRGRGEVLACRPDPRPWHGSLVAPTWAHGCC